MQKRKGPFLQRLKLESTIPDDEAIAARIQETLAKETLECVLLDRESRKMETYRTLTQSELQRLIPKYFESVKDS